MLRVELMSSPCIRLGYLVAVWGGQREGVLPPHQVERKHQRGKQFS